MAEKKKVKVGKLIYMCLICRKPIKKASRYNPLICAKCQPYPA